jgi:hypothetical protein
MQSDDCLDVSPDVEISNDLQKMRFQKTHQILVYDRSGFFVGDMTGPERVQVKFQGFEFHNVIRRPVTQMDCGKIRIARTGTKTGKFREGNPDFKRSSTRRCRPFFQMVFPNGKISVAKLFGLRCDRFFLFIF